MLTGEAPFTAKRREEIPSAQKKLKALPSYLTDDCKDVLTKMLAYDSKLRISFEDLFEHPFIVGIKDENSILASKGSSDSGVLSEVSGKEPIIEENSDENKSVDDFVLLSNEESVADFVFVAKDSHLAINIVETSQYIESQIETGLSLFKFAEKIKMNHEIIGSFAVSVQAMLIFENLIEFSHNIIEKYNLTDNLHPGYFELYQKVKSLFIQNQDKTEEISKEVDRLLASCDMNKLTLIESVGSQGLADSLIYNYTISLCKEGAKDEYLKDYNKSKEKYQEALVLLDYLCKGKEVNPSEEWNIVESFKNETQRRLNTVNVKITTL